ncbi:MAG: hypothetical protein E7483_01675 [Ruminococcaceae bacterium]|nr:hypothetical protein [Oscillospiraceae bacterium]
MKLSSNKKLISGILFALIPLFVCVLYAALQGVLIWDITPQSSMWNDELFYYKQIEGMVNSGMPLGYFGYNESTAATGTLGAWSPFLLYPYVLLGKLFGFTPYHTMWFNILLTTIALAVFYILAKPNTQQCITIAVLFIGLPVVARYVLSFMAEPLFFAAAIIMAGIAVKFQKDGYSKTLAAICYILVVYFALCRPWFLIFVFVPGYYQFKENWKKSILSMIASIAVFAMVYVLFSVPRCAPYFTPIINTEMFDVLVENGVLEFVKYVLYTVFFAVTSVIKASVEYFSSSNQFTDIYFLFVITAATLLFIVVQKTIRKEFDSQFAVFCGMTLILIIVFVALVLLYTYIQGARHLISVCLFALLVTVMQKLPKGKIFKAVVVTALIITGWTSTKSDYIYKLPTAEYPQDYIVVTEEAVMLSASFTADKQADRWDNTVVYDFPNLNVNYCYYLPENTGINLCMHSYVLDNHKDIKAKYVLSSNEKTLKEEYLAYGWDILKEGTDFVLYQTR